MVNTLPHKFRVFGLIFDVILRKIYLSICLSRVHNTHTQSWHIQMRVRCTHLCVSVRVCVSVLVVHVICVSTILTLNGCWAKQMMMAFLKNKAIFCPTNKKAHICEPRSEHYANQQKLHWQNKSEHKTDFSMLTKFLPCSFYHRNFNQMKSPNDVFFNFNSRIIWICWMFAPLWKKMLNVLHIGRIWKKWTICCKSRSGLDKCFNQSYSFAG